ncbi:endolytic transglycosylase MltG [Actinacidiphila bryophytorum]|uniref:endolytic transglycosylase MltG n=1 Tax=Actinacidiphila bryophytorum TaxID=1436133 RepID=UPI002176A9D5|nr:endolytic transglycosylase MltG [Actinacidiphila bryophytorum]UWE09432.1 endolytic transglycosylase MltG [Actinacidiphila bryophytorum]
MTDYGRGSGSEPWHPDDPLFGDAYDRGQGYQQQPQQPQPPQGGEWQDPYATGQHQQQQYQQQYPQQYPQQQYPQQGTGQYPQQQPQQQYPMQHPQQSGYDGYDTGSHQTYDTGSHPTGGYGTQDPYGGRPQQQDPYGGQQQPGYYGQGTGQYPQQQPQQQYRQQPQQPQQPGPGMQQQPPQGAQPGQPGPGQARLQQPAPGARPQEPAARPLRGAPAGTGDWDADDDSDPREHAFFADRDRDDDDDDVPTGNESGGRRSAKSQPKGGKKRRSGCACLTVLLVLGGGLAGGVYYGYGVYQDHFGPAPDYSGNGTPSVQVEIPKGSTLTTMGNLLKKAGVVKSVDAFTEAARKNPKGQTIQAGVYVLNKNMSAAAAVTMMLDPKSQNSMIISEGMRDKQIYAAIDKQLALKPGTTEAVAHAKVKTLGLPEWADTSSKVKDPLEGFLFPSRYSVAKGMKPEDLLKQMIGQAKQEFAQFDLAGEAKKQGLSSPYQLLTVASLVQAEGKTDDDFRKMAKVIYDRLLPSNKQQTNQLLQFDSTYNYIKNTSETKIATKDIYSLKDTYNTYRYKGLTPGPISNPGIKALQAAMNPDPGPWYFFISLDGKTTQFTETLAEFNKIKDK